MRQFVDDVLLTSVDPCFLRAVVSYTVRILYAARLYINAEPMLVPTKEFALLGKRLEAAAGTISNEPHHLYRVLAHLAPALHLSFCSLQKLLGLLQWLQCP